MQPHQKHLFDLPEHIIYLNTAAQSPSFKSVTQAGIDGVQQKSQPQTILNSDYFEPVTELKKLFAELIDLDDYNRVVTIPSVSYGMATVANNIKLNPNDEILIIDEQFPSNYYTWQKLADKYNARIKTIVAPNTSTNRVKLWNEKILDAITEKTAIVAMGNIHWSNGALFNLQAIREKTRLHNALLIVDGSQSVGAMPFSIKSLQPDALICAGYKWLFGPYGCAYAYYGPHFDHGNPIEENWSNRLESENFAGLTNYQSQYKPLANRYAVGESGNFIYVKMQIEALKHIIKLKPQAIQAYCKDISSEAVNELKALGCDIEDPEYRTHHLFGIKLPEGLDLNILKTAFKAQHIFVSFRGNYIRVSCHLFNTSDDFKKLVACMSSVMQSV